MAFVIKDKITGEYICSTRSRKIDRTDITYAQVYSTEKVAKQVSKDFQSRFDHWHETRRVLALTQATWFKHYYPNADMNEYLRYFEVLPR